MIARSHQLLFLSRLQTYKEEDFLALYKQKKIFEAYVHALSILRTTDMPYILSSLHRFREKHLKNNENLDFILDVFHQILGNLNAIEYK